MNNGKPYYYCCKYCGFVSASSSVFVDHKKMVHGKEQTRMSAPKKRSVEAHDDGRAGTASALHPSSNHQLQSDDDVMFLKEIKKPNSSDMDQHESDDLSDFMEDNIAGGARSNLGEEVIHLGGDNEDESQKLVRSIRENSSMDRQTLANSQPTVSIADWDQEYLFRTIPDFAATFPSIQEDAGPPSPDVQDILDQNENEENQNEIEIQHDLENIEVEPELPQWDDNPIPQEDEQSPDNEQNADAESRSPSGDPLIRCPFCSDVFGSIQEVTAHYFTHGIIQRPGSRPRQVQSKYVCAVCTDAFTSKKNYERHIAQAHPGYFLWRCEYCPYGAVSQQKIVAHNVIHTRQGEFECGFCNASFNTKSARGRHRNIHDDQVTGQGQANIYVVEQELGHLVSVDEEPPFASSYAAEPTRVLERSAPPEFTQSATPNDTNSSTNENFETDTHYGNNGTDLAEPCTFCDRRFPSMMEMESHLREECGGAPVGINEEVTSTIASQPTIEPPGAPPTIEPPTDGVESMELDPPVGPTNNDIEEVEEDEVQILPQVQMAPLPLFTLPTKNYQCPYCNYKDPFPAKLQRHVKHAHSDLSHIFTRMSEDASKLSTFITSKTFLKNQ